MSSTRTSTAARGGAEAHTTHTSTSPNYQIIASLDVGRQQVELEGFRFVQKQVETGDGPLRRRGVTSG